MQRVFISEEQINGATIRIAGEDAHHLRNVLRMREGETVLACAGDDWEYTCEIETFENDALVLRVCDTQRPGRELPSKITLLQCLPKGDKMETIIQKTVELGVSEIVPVVSSRCVVKYDEKKARAKVNRWNAIAKAAAEQSKRMIIPLVKEICSLRDVLIKQETMLMADSLPKKINPVLLMPYEGETDIAASRRILESIQPGQPVAVLIGPEGGFSPEEVEEARAAGFQTISLGKRILRTETAGMTALAILAYLLEEE